MFQTWMYVKRRTHWNGKEIRKAVQGGHTSFYVYQKCFKQRRRFIKRLCTVSPRGICLLVAVASLATFGVKANRVRITRVVIIATIAGCATLAFPIALSWSERGDLAVVAVPGRDADAYNKEGGGLESILQTMRTNKVLDPKDRSYAMRGVLEGLGVRLTGVNVKKSVGQVYQDLFEDLLKWGNALHLLMDAGYPELEDTPSWVPRWNDARDKTWLDPFYFHEHPLRLNVSESNKPWDLSEIHTLRVSGIWEGEISIRSGSFSNVSEKSAPEEHLANLHELIRFVSVIRRDCRALRKNESLATGFFEVMHARIRSRITPESGADFDVWFRIASEVCSPAWAEEAYLAARTDATPSAARIDEASLNDYLEKLKAEHKAMLYYIGRCSDIHDQRIMFLTSKGYLGTGPTHMKVGDRVALVRGVPMPLVLRNYGEEDRERYKIIGPAFISGLMEGELRDQKLADIVLV
jgi:hypothetical protein